MFGFDMQEEADIFQKCVVLETQSEKRSDMKWVRFRVRTVPDAEDLIISEMSELGMCGAQIEDNVPLTASEKERIYTFDADDPQDKDIAEGEAYVSFYAELNGEGKLCITISSEEDSASTFLSNTDSSKEGNVLSDEAEIYLTPDEQLQRMEERLKDIRQYTEIGAGTIAVSQMDDAAWKDKWKEYFHSFMIDDILVTPSWEKEPQDLHQAKFVLHIDPGTAFGTGAHETTQLAIRAIRKLIHLYKENEAYADETNEINDDKSSYEFAEKNADRSEKNLNDKKSSDINSSKLKFANEIKEMPGIKKSMIRMLDIGTGSGILSIMALMFGAETCVGTDLDPFTKEAVRDNLKANRIDSDRFKLILGNVIDDETVRSQVLKESGTGRNKQSLAKECHQGTLQNSVKTDEIESTCGEGYEIVVANILPVVLAPLTPTVPPFIKPGGYYVTSGILTEKKEMMESIIQKSGLEIVEISKQGEWCSITARKPM